MKRHLILLTLAVLIAGCSNPDPSIKLTYNPPPTTQFTGYTVSNRVQEVMGNSSVDSTVTFSRHTLTANDSGWTLLTVTDSILKGLAGPAVSDQMNLLLLGHEFTQVLDRSGHAIDMIGYEQLFARIDSALGPEQARMIRATMGPQLLSKREIREWNSTLARFAAISPLVPGAWVFDTTSVELPSGAALTYFQATRLLDTLQFDTKPCARIEVVAHTDPAKLAALVEITPEEMSAAFGPDAANVNQNPSHEISALQRSTWTVETATLLLHYKEMVQEVDVTLPTREGQLVNTHLREQEQKKFTY